MVFIASLTSIALTLATLAWVAPTSIPDQLVTTMQKGGQQQVKDLDLNVLNKTKQRLWYIYDKRNKIDNNFYSNSTDRLQAVMFSSDGWAVTYAPKYSKGTEKYWEGIDYQGTSYSVEKVFVDHLSKFTYVKFAGDGFPFISFENWNNLTEGSLVWELSYDRNVQHVLKNPLNLGNEKKYSIWKSQFFYNLADAKVGDLIINENGAMVGLIDKNGSIIYGWMIDSQYASILQSGSPNYMGVDWSGYMVHGFTKNVDFTKRLSGFYVESSPTSATSSTVGVGDLVVRIENKTLEEQDVSRQILSAPEQFLATVFRDNREVEILVDKTKVQ